MSDSMEHMSDSMEHMSDKIRCVVKYMYLSTYLNT